MKFLAEADGLVITLQGWEVFFALKRKLVIPRSSIANLVWQPDFMFRGSLFRVVGTGFPGVLYAGRFHANGARAFLYLRRPRGLSWTPNGTVTAPGVLAITTIEYRYPLLLLTCQEEIGVSLMNWFNAADGEQPAS